MINMMYFLFALFEVLYLVSETHLYSKSAFKDGKNKKVLKNYLQFLKTL